MATVRVIAVSWREDEGDWQASAIRCIWKQLVSADIPGVLKTRVRSLEAVVRAVPEVPEPVELDIIGHARPGRIEVGDSVLNPSLDSYRPLAAIVGRVRRLRLLGCHVGLIGTPVAEEAGPVLQLALAHFLGVPVAAALGPIFDYHFDAAGLKASCEPLLNEISFARWVKLETPYNNRRASEHDSKGVCP